MNNIAEIRNYILFLKNNCKLEVTLHPYGNEHLISDSELISFNIHENPYCVYIKTFPNAFNHCVTRQRKVLERCRLGSFCGTCYAGVCEYVYPICNGDSQVGFISVSGYKNSDYTSYINRCSSEFSIPQKSLRKNVSSLKDTMPSKELIDTLIAPLLRMLELSYIKSSDIKSQEGITDKITRYINQHYAETIKIDLICKVFSCSRSYVCHTFKKETGHTVHEHLMSVRLRSAKFLLTYSDLNVSEIAYAVGFNDSNYFSNTFKNVVGVSPRAYRKQQNSPENL